MSEIRVVLITAPDAACAETLSRVLLDERLAACVNVVPGVRSFYRWEGAIREDSELLLLVKTRKDLGDALAARVKELHPYELPQILELAAAGGSPAYLDWIRTETKT